MFRAVLVIFAAKPTVLREKSDAIRGYRSTALSADGKSGIHNAYR